MVIWVNDFSVNFFIFCAYLAINLEGCICNVLRYKKHTTFPSQINFLEAHWAPIEMISGKWFIGKSVI